MRDLLYSRRLNYSQKCLMDTLPQGADAVATYCLRLLFTALLRPFFAPIQV